MFLSILIVALSLLFSFFLHFYGCFKLLFCSIIFISLFLCFFNKKQGLLFLLSSILFSLWHEYQLNEHFKKHQTVIRGKNYRGIILDKKELNKKYSYLVNLYSIDINNKKENLDARIIIITKKNIPLGQFVSIPFIFFLQKHESINALKLNHLHFTSHGVGMASAIKTNNSIVYEKIYSFFNFLFILKENWYHLLNTDFIGESKFFFDTIFLGKSVENKKNRYLFSIWGISHYLARSGLHIQICITILMSIFLFLGFSYTTSALFQLFFLFLFYFFTFSSISFFRAFIMFFLFLLCKLGKLPTTSLHTLSSTIIITFFMYPFCFLQLGTQLTFFTTFILALISYMNQFTKKK